LTTKGFFPTERLDIFYKVKNVFAYQKKLRFFQRTFGSLNQKALLFEPKNLRLSKKTTFFLKEPKSFAYQKKKTKFFFFKDLKEQKALLIKKKNKVFFFKDLKEAVLSTPTKLHLTLEDVPERKKESKAINSKGD
jgi:maltodextrin utilization protein YvdJ